MNGHKPWTYFEEKEIFEPKEDPVLPHQLGGSEIFSTCNIHHEKYVMKVQNSRQGSDNSVPIEQCLQHFVAKLQDELCKRGFFCAHENHL